MSIVKKYGKNLTGFCRCNSGNISGLVLTIILIKFDKSFGKLQKVNCKKLRVPRKCEKCGAPFDISINIGFLIYFLASLFLIVFTLCLVKSIIKNQWMLYVILILDIVIIPNCVERKLFQIGIMSIKIWNKK